MHLRHAGTRLGGRRWPSFFAQIALVVGVELADDVAHALTSQNSVSLAERNALQLVRFESAHDLLVEPRIQTFFIETHRFLGRQIGQMELVPFFNTMYGLGHVSISFAFAVWMYLFRRPLFAFVRDIFLFTNLLAVLVYELFPTAPPRLVPVSQGESPLLIDTVFGSGGSGFKIGFNEFAAMPSLHVAWALIVGISLATVVRSPMVRVVATLYPVLMTVTVMVTGNHYITDALGAAAVLVVGLVLAVLTETRRSRQGSIARALSSLRRRRFAPETAISGEATGADSRRQPAA